jgi:dipeptidyl aminopeptidase B
MAGDEDLDVQTAVDFRMSSDSSRSSSTTSIVFDRINDRLLAGQASVPQKRANGAHFSDAHDLSDFDEDDPLKEEGSSDLETGPFLGRVREKSGAQRMDRSLKRFIIIAAAAITAAWLLGLFVYIWNGSYKHSSQIEHNPQATVSRGNGKHITLDQVQEGFWRTSERQIEWIPGPDGEDGLLLEVGGQGKDYVVVEDVRSMNPDVQSSVLTGSRTLITMSSFEYGDKLYEPQIVLPDRKLKKVLVGSKKEKNWRHSSTAVYFIFDVDTQKAEPLVPGKPGARCQLAQWSPTSDAIAFTMDNNLFLRRIGSETVVPITRDGGVELFYGVPDWVYEEEVFSGSSATWWSDDGKYIAFLRTNETGVPEYPVQYFIERPSKQQPKPGEENYPEVRKIKYPKAGAHNPVVDLQFYDVDRGDVFAVDIAGEFADDDRLITTVLWAGSNVIIKETNRVSDVMRVALVDVKTRTGKAVRTMDVAKIDGGWFEISTKTTFVPADAKKSRPNDGYIDMVIHENGDHLAYFTPLDNPEPIMLTSGDWEVDDGPAAVDFQNNLVYFRATKESSIQRHVYTVRLDGTGMAPVTDTATEGYYTVSFSSGAGYALINYKGPSIPWQRVLSTPGNPTQYNHTLETNDDLAEKAKKHELPLLVYGTITVDDVKLNYLERRPPHFNERKKYPVLFQQYSGPGSQSVDKSFRVDFNSYVAAGLGYIVVTVDGRGTGFIGRKNRVLIRERLGHYESHDQIAAAQHWASLPYVDPTRLAIWGWSYGGYNTLKTLEQDGGRTFSYGMAVAPVTDWAYYDTIYTERYMRTPQTNAGGYRDSAISNVTALAGNVRWLLMHGVADDNVHMQNSLTLLDRLNLATVENYDVHVFPDSDHGIYFHNANRIVYDSKFGTTASISLS